MNKKRQKGKKLLSVLLSTAMAVGMMFTGGISGTKTVEAASALGSGDFLKTNGTQIKKNYGNGDTVYLRGTNAGGWLVQEDWMNPTNASDQRTMMNTLANRFGASTRDQLVATYEDNYWTTQDFNNCAAMGMSVIRLPFTYMNLCEDNGNLKSNAFDRLDWFVSNCSSRGIYVILDMHGAFGSQNGMDHSGEINGGTSLYYNQDNRRKTLNLWAKIAEHFKGNPAVAAYDILNEPGIKAAATYSLQWDFYNEIYNTIRSKDSDHIIIMESCWDADNLPRPSAYGWTNVAYEYHYYPWNNISDSAGQASYTASKVSDIANHNYGVPTFVGEFTCFEQDAAWRNTMSTYNQQGWHWTTWSYKVTGNSSWGIYNHSPQTVDIYNDSADTIRSKWSNVGTDKGWVNSKIYNLVKEYLPGTVDSSGGSSNSGGSTNSGSSSGSNSSSGSVTIYQDANYGGRTVSLGEGSYSLSALQAKGFRNDDLSSLKVPSGYVVTLFEHDNFTGNTLVCTSDTNYVGNGFNDKMSSIKISRSGSNYNSGSGSSYPTTKLASGKYYIQAIANDKFVCAENGGSDPITANRDSYGGAWETFIFENNNDGTVNIKAEANNKYLCAVIDEYKQLLPRSASPSTWERFQIYEIKYGEYGIRSVENGKYVQANLNDGGKLMATSDSIAGAWEAFRIVRVGDSPANSSGNKQSIHFNNADTFITAIANNKVVCAEDGGNDVMTARSDSCGGAWEAIQIVSNDDGTVSLRSAANGKYVCAVIDERNQLLPRSGSIGDWEKFVIEKITDGEYGIRACANGKYVQANLGDGGKLYATSDRVAGAWEAFKITKIGESSSSGNQQGVHFNNADTYITAIANNKVVCAENGGKDVMTARSDSCGGAWEAIQIVSNDDGTVSLRSAANGKYVCAVIDEKNQLLPRSGSIGDWEKFIIEKIKDGEYAIKACANGKYVQANLDDGGKLYATSDRVAGAWEAFKITKIK